VRRFLADRIEGARGRTAQGGAFDSRPTSASRHHSKTGPGCWATPVGRGCGVGAARDRGRPHRLRAWGRARIRRASKSEPCAAATHREVTVHHRGRVPHLRCSGSLENAEILEPPDVRADMVEWLATVAAFGISPRRPPHRSATDPRNLAVDRCAPRAAKTEIAARFGRAKSTRRDLSLVLNDRVPRPTRRVTTSTDRRRRVS